ncbi:MAG: isovaleryl-CoA dehydrogenase [Myxococcaceae bacterium]|nr:isovaleryl-CoA dehydrogenase [Myxococcaceae bacterium]
MSVPERERGQQLEWATHEVKNQPPPLVGHDLFSQDAALVEGFRREGAAWAEEHLRSIGRKAGSAEAQAWGALANELPPRLRTHDRYGHRVDEVDYHPAYHELMKFSVGAGLSAFAPKDARPGTHVVRAAGFFVFGQVEAGHGCPISMTHAAVPALRVQPELAAEWEPRFTSRTYDFGLRPAAKKAGALCGMAMTEKQGGSDVRANTTRAVPVSQSGPGREYLLTGHKWFCSAPMCDAFLVLAQAPGGLSCFLLPRVLPDGTRNRMHLMRLKDKLGNRSNASSEVEFHGALAWMVGEEGRGVRTIIEMVNFTRLDCVIGSASIMRQGVTQAIHHATYRTAFGRELVNQPLMRNVLADLALEAEAATTLFLRLAAACDRADKDEGEALFKRIALAVSKYWVCKRTPAHAAEALECLGGNGYVEDSGMPRLYREAPVNSIWEGSGNVNALDVLRAVSKQPEVLGVLLGEIEKAKGGNAHLDRAVDRLKHEVSSFEDIEARSRRLVEQLAVALQASLLVRHAPAYMSDAFCASRLGGEWGAAFGTLSPKVDFVSIIERSRIALPGVRASLA